jgi:hypothetical protein
MKPKIDHNSLMIPFKLITDDEPALVHSSLLKAVLLTIAYIESNGPIGLTPSNAFKRYFVKWAVEAFAWPEYTAQDLYAFNKVLNEADFLPLLVMHDVLLTAKLARHNKGAMQLTRLAKELKSQPAKLWTLLANTMLCVLDHSQYTRFGDTLVGNWDVFLNVINVEAQGGVSEGRLCSILFGVPEDDIWRADFRLAAAFCIHVLRPLCWVGLLVEYQIGESLSKRGVMKTPLWLAALALSTDNDLQPITRH